MVSRPEEISKRGNFREERRVHKRQGEEPNAIPDIEEVEKALYDLGLLENWGPC